MIISGRLAPLGLLAVLALIFFGKLVLHPSHTLYADHSDLIALHVPWETFLSEAWRETGERPLWNPLQFAGLPFVHDVQAAISYPPHEIFRWVSQFHVGPALSWLIVAHVILAGWGMYVYSRSIKLGPTAAMVSALGFMFAGKWLLHLTLAGHYAFIGLAWLPWTLFGLEYALRHRSGLAAIWTGASLGMLTLSTHPQLTLYSGLFLLFWTLPFARTAGRFATWLGIGLVVALVALALASIQLLPALESASLASRGISGLPESPSLSLRTLLRTFGPSSDGVQPVVSWEPKCGFGLIGIALACLAVPLTTGPNRRRAWWALGTVIGLTVFALGGAVLFHGLPVFRMFRQPSRMFLVAALPLALLSGITTQAMIDNHDSSSDQRSKARRIFVFVASIGIALLLLSLLSTGLRSLRVHPYLFSLLATLPLAWWLIGTDANRRGWRVAWVGVFLIDLVSLTYPHVQTCDLGVLLAPSATAQFVAEHVGPLDRVLDRHVPGDQSGTPLGPAVATNLGLHQVRGYNPLDLVRTKDYLAFISDPIIIKHPYNCVINMPIHHKALLDLLGVRFLIQPSDPAQRSTPGEFDPDLDRGWTKVFDDPAPLAFSFAYGGTRHLPPYEVLENLSVFPRAFVVPKVARLPFDRQGRVQAMTTTDFRKIALIESSEPTEIGAGQGTFHPASIRSYAPNRIEIHVEGPGLLVLTDPWYPGWHATIDEQPTLIHRADYLFRGITVPSGLHKVVFTFQPRSYARGYFINTLTLIIIFSVTIISLIRMRSNVRSWIASNLGRTEASRYP